MNTVNKLFVCLYKNKSENSNHVLIVADDNADQARTRVQKLLHDGDQISTVREAPYITALEKDITTFEAAA